MILRFLLFPQPFPCFVFILIARLKLNCKPPYRYEHIPLQNTTFFIIVLNLLLHLVIISYTKTQTLTSSKFIPQKSKRPGLIGRVQIIKRKKIIR